MKFFSATMELFSSAASIKHTLSTELSTLQLYGSNEVLMLVKKYRDIAELQLNELKHLAKIKSNIGEKVKEGSIRNEDEIFEAIKNSTDDESQKNRIEELAMLHNQIVLLMRKELREYQ